MKEEVRDDDYRKSSLGCEGGGSYTVPVPIIEHDSRQDTGDIKLIKNTVLTSLP